jgi:hypothetical protein
MKNTIFYLENNKITSDSLTELEIFEMTDIKYNLSVLDIKNYITAYDKVINSLGCDKYKLTEGITKDNYKYKNILVDLYHKTIPSEILYVYPIGIVFNIKQIGYKHNIIQDLTKTDINNYKNSKSIDLDFFGNFSSDSYFYQDMQQYRSTYSNYAGNSYTYYVFKQLVKLFLTEVYLYSYQGNILTYNELVNNYLEQIMNHPNPSSVKSISELLYLNEIIKIKYSCIKVEDPCQIDYFTLSDIHISLINVNKLSNFKDSYESLIKKNFNDFWDFNKADLNL